MDQHATPPPRARRPRRNPLGHALGSTLLVGLALLAGACSSTGGSGPGSSGNGSRLRVVLKDYLGGQAFEIVSESYADRVEYLSEARSDASRKFMPDDVLEAFVDYIHAEGMAEHAQPGRAPTSGGQVITRAFEVERDGEITCWPVGKGTEVEEKTSFILLTRDFLDVYRELPAFQAIENPEGHDLFRDPKRQKTGR